MRKQPLQPRVDRLDVFQLEQRARGDYVAGVEPVVESMLRAARIPGAAVAIVRGDRELFSKGFGYSDASARLAVTSDTVYPIASTSKAINATLLGMLVEEGKISWDAPVRTYLPQFRLQAAAASELTTVRDLVTMRTGLPRHDFLWLGNKIPRADVVSCLAHLAPSAEFRERFQYNNLTSTVAGHIAEVVTGRSWEELVQHRILDPLGMNDTGFEMPSAGDVTLAYRETSRRDLVRVERQDTSTISPAGGSIHSTVSDMSRWIAFNLNGGSFDGKRLIDRATLAHLQSPCVLAGDDTTRPSPHAAYGLGWFIDTYNNRARVTHSGNLHGINSCVMLFPSDGLGIVSFVNFATHRFAQLINEHVFDCMSGLRPVQTVEETLSLYENKIAECSLRNASPHRIANTRPSQPLEDYLGSYAHPAYGRIEIHRRDNMLCLTRNALTLPLEHWHYDAWVVAENELFEIHQRHPWERANRILFETDADGAISAFTLQVEPAVAAARFSKDSHQAAREADGERSTRQH